MLGREDRKEVETTTEFGRPAAVERQPVAARPVERPPAERRREEQEEQEIERSMKVVSGGTTLEALAGAAVITLSIIGLANVVPGYMMAIAAICAGAALLIEGAAVMARYSKLVHETEAGAGKTTKTELGGGTSLEVLGGIAGIVLGILSVIGIVPDVLSAIAVIVFGGTLLLSSGTTSRLRELETLSEHRHERLHAVTRQALNAAAGIQAMVGLAAIVLGILGLVFLANAALATTLTLVGLLCIGSSLLFSGGAITSRMSAFLAEH
jgi:hypothetical protein